MIIDMTPQFAVILQAMDVLLAVAGGALLLEMLGQAFGRRRELRPSRGVPAGLAHPARS